MNQPSARRALVVLAFVASLSGCGGSGSGDSASTTSGVNGVAQKGPLMQGSTVWVNLLNPTTWQPNGSEYTFEITNNLGLFNAATAVFNGQYADSTAIGYYVNELSGRPSTDTITVRGLSDLRNDKAINLNVLTSLIRGRMKTLMTRAVGKLSFSAARTQAQKELLGAFYIYNAGSLFPGGASQPANFNEADLSKARPADQVLAAISGLFMAIGQDGNGTNLWLSRFESDLADDGLINNSPGYAPSTVSVLKAAQTSADLRAVAVNLNSIYGGSPFASDAVAQWNDSSGGDDQVVDKFKFSVTVDPNTVAVSPTYSAMPDDVGQCISVTGGTLNRNGAPVTGGVKAANGDSFSISGVSASGAGQTTTLYLQRSSVAAGTNCPSTPAPSGQTRIYKFAITVNGFPLAQAWRDLYARNYVRSFTASGTVDFNGVSYPLTGTVQYSFALGGASSFEGSPAVISTVSTFGPPLQTSGPITFRPSNSISIEYRDPTSFAYFGSLNLYSSTLDTAPSLPASYCVASIVTPLPAHALPGQGGPLHTQTCYADSSKAVVVSTITTSFTTTAGSTGDLVLTVLSEGLNANGIAGSTTRRIASISQTGVATFVGYDFDTYGSVVTYRYSLR